MVCGRPCNIHFWSNVPFESITHDIINMHLTRSPSYMTLQTCTQSPFIIHDIINMHATPLHLTWYYKHACYPLGIKHNIINMHSIPIHHTWHYKHALYPIIGSHVSLLTAPLLHIFHCKWNKSMHWLILCITWHCIVFGQFLKFY